MSLLTLRKEQVKLKQRKPEKEQDKRALLSNTFRSSPSNSPSPTNYFINVNYPLLN